MTVQKMFVLLNSEHAEPSASQRLINDPKHEYSIRQPDQKPKSLRYFHPQRFVKESAAQFSGLNWRVRRLSEKFFCFQKTSTCD